jgi:hypothetical protein
MGWIDAEFKEIKEIAVNIDQVMSIVPDPHNDVCMLINTKKQETYVKGSLQTVLKAISGAKL